MKKYILFTALLSLVFLHSRAQFSETFETLTLDSGKVLNGKNGDTMFRFYLGGDLNMPVTWDTGFGGLWTGGWAISRKIDSATVKSDFFRHLYCAKPGKGVGNSNTFAIGQQNTWISFPFGGRRLSSFYISNSTYAYNSMKLGDMFAKKFGGKTGKDPDYFFVRVREYFQGVQKDSQDIYLADFRNADSTKDYIVSDWREVVVKTFMVDSLAFEIYSSDTGIYGINTPTFFAVDNVTVDWTESVSGLSESMISAYPNPSSGVFNFHAAFPVEHVEIFNLKGSLVYSENPVSASFSADLSHLPAGVYFVKGVAGGSTFNEKLILRN